MAGAGDRQPDREREVGQLAVALGRQLLVGEPGPAARAPRHHVVPAVDQPAPMALRQEGPDRVVVLVGVRVVAVVPVHPHPEANGLLGDAVRETLHARLAELDEAVDPVALDVALVCEAQLLLGLDLDPQALAVEAVLVALPLAEHGVVALVEVLVGAAPGVVDAHRVVRRDRPVDEAVAPLGLRVAREVALHRPALAPDVDHLPLQRREVQLRRDRLEHVYASVLIYDKSRPDYSGTGCLNPRPPAVPPAIDRWRVATRSALCATDRGPMAPPNDIGWRTREALPTALPPLGASGSGGMATASRPPASTARARCRSRCRRRS